MARRKKKPTVDDFGAVRVEIADPASDSKIFLDGIEQEGIKRIGFIVDPSSDMAFVRFIESDSVTWPADGFKTSDVSITGVLEAEMKKEKQKEDETKEKDGGEKE